MAHLVTSPPSRAPLFVVVAVALAASRCSSPDARPPLVQHGSASDNFRSCSEISLHGSLSGNRITVEAGIASCPATGQTCPLFEGPGFTSACALGEVAFALCSSGVWVLTCASVDAGAASDAASGADAPEDATLDAATE